jgi:hypothetical protein
MFDKQSLIEKSLDYKKMHYNTENAIAKMNVDNTWDKIRILDEFGFYVYSLPGFKLDIYMSMYHNKYKTGYEEDYQFFEECLERIKILGKLENIRQNFEEDSGMKKIQGDININPYTVIHVTLTAECIGEEIIEEIEHEAYTETVTKYVCKDETFARGI